MNYLLNSPYDYHDWTCKENMNVSHEEKDSDFWKNYYKSNKKFTNDDIHIYKNIIPYELYKKMLIFKDENILWKFGYTNKKETLFDTNLGIDEIHHFYADLYHNLFFSSLFYKIILPNLSCIENKDNIQIDRLFITGQLHGLSDLFHKDERSSVNYGPSVYFFLNDNWKTYHDGNLSFLLDSKTNDIMHVENKSNKIIVFPPDMYHRSSEISGYGLFDNAFNSIVQYHLIYK